MSWEQRFVQEADKELDEIFDRLADLIILKVSKRLGIDELQEDREKRSDPLV